MNDKHKAPTYSKYKTSSLSILELLNSYITNRKASRIQGQTDIINPPPHRHHVKSKTHCRDVADNI